MQEISMKKLIKALIRKKQDLIRLQKYEQAARIRSAIEELESYVELSKPRKQVDSYIVTSVIAYHVGFDE